MKTPTPLQGEETEKAGWAAHLLAMAGNAPDFPLREEIGETSGEDVPRVKLAG